MSEKGVQVIDRALDIIEILSIEREGLGVTEIGNRLSLHKSTVYRILSALAERGYIAKDQKTNNYKIGLKLVEVSSVYLNNVELKTEARPHLNELTKKFGQTSHIAILDGFDAVYIDKLDTQSSIRLYSQIGKRVPLHVSGLGKVLISDMNRPELEVYLKDYEFNPYTDNTIISKDEFFSTIEKVKKQGWALDDEEHEAGIRCIAAPVKDYRGKTVAAISISGPSNIIAPELDVETSSTVMAAAREISKRLGYRL